MPLSQQQKTMLSDAMEEYSFPPVFYDFINNVPSRAERTADLEALIKQELISNDLQRVKDGLSNVLYWGYAQMGKQLLAPSSIYPRTIRKPISGAILPLRSGGIL